MTDPPQEVLYRRINLLGAMVMAGWLVFALALAMAAILLYGKAKQTESQTQGRLDELSRQVAELKGQLSALAGNGSAASRPQGAAVASGTGAGQGVATPPPGQRVAGVAGATTQPGGAASAGNGPAPGTPVAHAGGGRDSQPASATQPATGYSVSPVEGLLGPDPNRPAGLAGWFYDLKTAAADDDANPLFMIISGPKTVATALGEIAKVTPADATRQQVSSDDQVVAAQLFLQTGDANQAHRWASAVAASAPKNGRVWLIAGLASARLKALDRAITELTASVEAMPARPEPLKALGEVYLAAGKMDQAVATYRIAAAAVPKDIVIGARLGDLLVRARQVDEAIRQYARVLLVDPKLSSVRGRLAQLLVEADRAKDAVELLDATPPDAPPEVRMDLARGQALLAVNDLPAAEAALEKAVENTPLSAQGWHLLGKVRLLLRKNARAVVALERSLAIDSTVPDAWKYLGVALANDSKLDEAIAKLNEAVRMNVASADTHYTLAILHLWKQQPDGALAALRQAVKLDPSYLNRARSEPHFTNAPADSPLGRYVREGKESEK